jgi:hypothetical protein
MAFDAEAALAKLNEIQRKEVESNEKIRKFITANKTRYNTVVSGGMEIKVRALIPRKLRHELMAMSEKKAVTLEENESMMYQVIAAMCIEKPFDQPEMWEYFDAEMGIAEEVLDKIFEINKKTEKDIKSFQ